MTCSRLFRLSSEFFGVNQPWRQPPSGNGMFQTPTPVRRSARGFTLIELLVVIAIVAILISLIMVGVGRANQAGRATVCRGNLRTIGLAANTYSSSNKGRLPSPRTDTPSGWTSLKTDPNDPTATTREDAANTYIGWVRTETSVPGSIKADGFGPQYETNIALQKEVCMTTSEAKMPTKVRKILRLACGATR